MLKKKRWGFVFLSRMEKQCPERMLATIYSFKIVYAEDDYKLLNLKLDK